MTRPATELEPLMVEAGTSSYNCTDQDETNNDDFSESNSKRRDSNCKKASVRESSINIAKTCIGTGTLALPFAASQGGLVLNILGLAFIAWWNIFSMERLIQCLELMKHDSYTGSDNNNNSTEQTFDLSLPKEKKHRRSRSALQRIFHELGSARINLDKGQETENEQCVGESIQDNNGGAIPSLVEPNARVNGVSASPVPEGTTTFGKVAWRVMGPKGLYALDIILVMLLMGIVIAYEDAIGSFIRATPFTTGSRALDAIWTVFVIAPLSCAPNMKHLSKFSALGLAAVFGTFVVIAGYGLKQNHGLWGFLSPSILYDSLWPKNGMAGVSNWFGVVVFGFGVVPITYNVQESMQQPQFIMSATRVALLSVYIAYLLMGSGIQLLYAPTLPSFDGDVLEVGLPNPSTQDVTHANPSWIPTTVRLAMTFVVLVTAPLLVVPCGELIEGKFESASSNPRWVRIVVRWSICAFCAAVSVFVPGFVYVISFLGSFCVALVSFIVPPLFHLLLLEQLRRKKEQEGTGWKPIPIEALPLRRAFYSDVLMMTWGVLATLATSVFTLLDAWNHHTT